MSDPYRLNKRDETFSDLEQKLMVSGFVCPESSCVFSLEVKRGMSILSMEDLEVGKVAAVVLNNDDHKATHLLLSRLPERIGYWLVPVSSIRTVDNGTVKLSIPEKAIETLLKWHSL